LDFPGNSSGRDRDPPRDLIPGKRPAFLEVLRENC
jgi:hypothetical protein